MIGRLAVVGLLAVASWTDLRNHEIHDAVSILLAMTGLLMHGLSGAVVGMTFLAAGIALFVRDHWAMGDAMLFGGVGTVVAPFPLTFLLAFLPISAAWVGYRSKMAEEPHPPFAPAMAMAWLVAALTML